MSLRHYVFDSEWEINAPKETVFEVLKDAKNYPKWFSLIKEVEEIEQGRFTYISKSVLPYKLIFESKQEIVDPENGVLQGAMVGDLEGYSKWEITPNGTNSCKVRFYEDVVTNKKLLNVLAPIARPFFKLNHSLAMKSGEKGLNKYVRKS